MYAKSFLALDGNGRLTGARTAQTAPYDSYTCHLCGSALRYHPQYDTERPWFEHADEVNRPGFPGECFICELRLPDHRFRWKH
ncbi:zinc-ribbon domain-containing protein, partial [Escherichia coli]